MTTTTAEPTAAERIQSVLTALSEMRIKLEWDRSAEAEAVALGALKDLDVAAWGVVDLLEEE